METQKFVLPAVTKIHYVYNGKIINDAKYQQVKAEFPDPGNAMILASEWDRKTEDGKYTYIYLHNNRAEIEFIPNSEDKKPKYPFA